MDWPWMVNEVSSYSVKVQERWDMVGEDIFVNKSAVNSVSNLTTPKSKFLPFLTKNELKTETFMYL